MRRLPEPGQYTSIAFTERLAAAGAAPSVSAVGDALDNALAETHIGLFETELIRPRGPWRGLDDVELATLEWVDWHNNRRLHTACHDLTPVEYEQILYGQHPAQQAVGGLTPRSLRTRRGGSVRPRCGTRLRTWWRCRRWSAATMSGCDCMRR